MNQIKVTTEQRLDEIVYSKYGTLEFMAIVIENNPHLNKKIILEVDDIVNLPIVIKAKKELEDELW